MGWFVDDRPKWFSSFAPLTCPLPSNCMSPTVTSLPATVKPAAPNTAMPLSELALKGPPVCCSTVPVAPLPLASIQSDSLEETTYRVSLFGPPAMSSVTAPRPLASTEYVPLNGRSGETLVGPRACYDGYIRVAGGQIAIPVRRETSHDAHWAGTVESAKQKGVLPAQLGVVWNRRPCTGAGEVNKEATVIDIEDPDPVTRGGGRERDAECTTGARGHHRRAIICLCEIGEIYAVHSNNVNRRSRHAE